VSTANHSGDQDYRQPGEWYTELSTEDYSLAPDPYATEDAPSDPYTSENDVVTMPQVSPETAFVGPLDYQVGGDHYKDFAVQPIEYITKNKLSFCEGNVVKYISRHAKKHGVEDLKKVIHYAKLEAKLTYGEDL